VPVAKVFGASRPSPSLRVRVARKNRKGPLAEEDVFFFRGRRSSGELAPRPGMVDANQTNVCPFDIGLPEAP
jgi:hypothetical protein